MLIFSQGNYVSQIRHTLFLPRNLIKLLLDPQGSQSRAIIFRVTKGYTSFSIAPPQGHLGFPDLVVSLQMIRDLACRRGPHVFVSTCTIITNLYNYISHTYYSNLLRSASRSDVLYVARHSILTTCSDTSRVMVPGRNFVIHRATGGFSNTLLPTSEFSGTFIDSSAFSTNPLTLLA